MVGLPRPSAGTDAARMLDAMLASHPLPAWNLNRDLGITAHSRACDLRDLGWDVEAVPGERIPGTRKRVRGYRLRGEVGAEVSGSGGIGTGSARPQPPVVQARQVREDLPAIGARCSTPRKTDRLPAAAHLCIDGFDWDGCAPAEVAS